MADNDVLRQLRDCVEFHTEIEIPPVKMQTTEFSGLFREKLDGYLKHRREDLGSTDVDQFTWRQIEIGNMTGNELLRAMVQICRTPEWISMGNCVLMIVAENEDAALFRIQLKNVEIATTPVSAIAKKKMYFKLFNERYCASQRNEHPGYAKYYKTSEIKKMRAEVPSQLQKFMDEPIKHFYNSLYRHAFIGLVAEVAKVETVDAAEREFLSSIPVAACIYLAVHNNMCGDLQDMFGQYDLLPFDEWKSEYRTNNPDCTEQELQQFFRLKKFELRREAATSIVTRSGINENNVLDAIGCIREFYGLNEE